MIPCHGYTYYQSNKPFKYCVAEKYLGLNF